MTEPDKLASDIAAGKDLASPAEAQLPALNVATPLLLIALAELVAVSAALMSHQTLIVLALIHLTAVVCLIVMSLWVVRRGGDVVIVALALIAGTATGPAGAFGAALLAIARGGNWRPSRLIKLWYDRIALSTAIDPDTRLSEDVGVGRTLSLDTTPPESFPSLMLDGSLAKRQAILGYIARHFHPAYLATLKLALESPEPVLRVQAAAVASHVTPAVRASLSRCLAEAAHAETPGDRLDIVGELDDLLSSGLLDQSEENRALAAADENASAIVAAVASRPMATPLHSDPTRAAERDATLERILLAHARYADLRVHRRISAIRERHPTARYRRLRAYTPMGSLP